MIEIECKRCHARHYPRTLRRSLLCCSRRNGVTRLVAALEDPKTGHRWFTVTNAAVVRDVQVKVSAPARPRTVQTGSGAGGRDT